MWKFDWFVWIHIVLSEILLTVFSEQLLYNLREIRASINFSKILQKINLPRNLKSNFNRISDGSGVGDKKSLLTSFFPVTSTNVGISHKKVPTFSFNCFATMVQNFKAIPGATLKLLNLNQDHPSKKWFFW